MQHVPCSRERQLPGKWGWAECVADVAQLVGGGHGGAGGARRHQPQVGSELKLGCPVELCSSMILCLILTNYKCLKLQLIMSKTASIT